MGARATSSALPRELPLRVRDPEAEPTGPRRKTLSGVLPWLCLAVGLSPGLLELGRHVVATPWARYTVVVGGLLALAMAGDSSPRVPRRRAGALLLGAAVCTQLLAAAIGPPALGRIAIPLGIIGLACWYGAPALRLAALSVFLVPVPYTLVSAASRGLESGLLQVAVVLVSPLTAGLETQGHVLSGVPSAFWVRPPHGGIPLAALFASAAGIQAVRAGKGLASAGAAVLLGAAVALPVQILALGIAVLLAASGRPVAAWTWLDHGTLVLFGSGLLVIAAAIGRRALP